MHSDEKSTRAFPLLAMTFAVIAGLLSATASISAGEPRAREEYEIKAALVYNFLKFIDWPSKAAQGDIRLCVVGDLSRAWPLAGLDSQAVSGRRLSVVQVDRHAVSGCDVLFLLKGGEQQLPEILEAVKGGKTLTIGEAEGIAGKGVIINFLIVQKKVRFEINSGAAREAGIMISAKLMKLAGRVYDSRAGGE